MNADYKPTPFFVDKEHRSSIPFLVVRLKHVRLREISNRYPGNNWAAQVMRADIALRSFPLTFHELRHHLAFPSPEETIRKIGQKFPLLKIKTFTITDLMGEDHKVDAVFFHDWIPIGWEAYGREVTPEEVKEAQEKVTSAQIAALLACHAAMTKGNGKA